MIWSNQQVSKLVADNAKFSPLPKQLLNRKFCIWDNDIADLKNRAFEWEQFIDGKTTLHTKWNGATATKTGNNFNGKILLNSISYGNSPETFNSMFMENNTISVLVGAEEFADITVNFPDIQNKLITLGDNIDNWFVAKLFPIVYDIDGTNYGGKIELVNLKFVIQELGSGIESVNSNIKIGNFGETTYIPKMVYDKVNLAETLEVVEKVNITPKSMEVYIPEAAATIGIDLLRNDLTRYKDLTHSFNVTNFPSQTDYSIIPTQFKIFGVDNYGVSSEGDITNSIKALMFTEALETGVYAGTKSATDKLGGTGIVGGILSVGSTLLSKSGSLGSKFFGDRGETSTAPAISTRQIRNDNSFLKLFIEPDMSSTNEITNGRLDISSQDLYEINRNKGTAEQTQSPLLPDGFNPKQDLGGLFKSLADKTSYSNKYMSNGVIRKAYNILGVTDIANQSDSTNYNVSSELEWLKLPNSNNADLKLNDNNFNNFLAYGSPRRNSGSSKLSPLYTPDNWETYIRSNSFRPDAYSWWNWPILYPSSVVNVYKENNSNNFIAYDKTGSNPTQQSNHWSTGLLVENISNNESANPRDNFTSYKIDGLDNDLFEFQSMCITSSQFIVKVMDDNNNYEDYVFNSEGLITGTAANWNNIFRF